MILNRVRDYLLQGGERSRKAKKNILYSFLNKGLSILISLAIVPITIDYLNPEQYGIWLTLSSIVAWLSFFDVGLVNGFRNRFAEAKAKGDSVLARKYVSTTYFSMICIFGLLLIILEIVNPFINWPSILNVSQEYRTLLTAVASIVLIGVCTQFVANVFPTLLSADQRPAVSAMINTVGQGLALFVILLLTNYPKQSMTYIAVALSWIPVFVTIIVSVWSFTHNYKDFSPSIKLIDLSLIKSILNLGVRFFLIQVSIIVIFQFVNVILSRVLGPESVTVYNISYKYFSVIMMVFNIVISPYWSAYTDAYIKNEYDWMKSILNKLNKIWLLLVAVGFIMLLVSPFVYRFWIKDAVRIPILVSISMYVFMSVLSMSNMYMTLINGTGKILLQMIIYLVCASVSIPISILICRKLGIPGILIVLSTIYSIQAIFARLQLSRILKKTATGIWNK